MTADQEQRMGTRAVDSSDRAKSASSTARAARLALAKESAPKPPACKGERTDSDRYAELRALVEAYQSAKSYDDDVPLQALRDWSHR